MELVIAYSSATPKQAKTKSVFLYNILVLSESKNCNKYFLDLSL